jgi:predicted ArsR family transcriptional regulator
MANQQQLRKLLWANPEGLTARQAAEALGVEVNNMHKRLKKMIDTYILGWTNEGGRPRALWAVVVTPEDCPRPPKQNETLKKYEK